MTETAPSLKNRPGLAEIAGRFRSAIRRYPIIVLLLLLVVGVLSSLPQRTFLTGPNLLNIARTFSWLAVAAIGESLVIIIGGIDLSVGATMGLAGLTCALGMQNGLPVLPAMIAGLAVGGLIGWLNGTIVALSLIHI